MEIEVNIPKDLSKIKSRVIFGFTKRQLICFALAAIVAGPCYFLIKSVLGSDIAVIFLVILAMPFFVFAVYERNGFAAEKIFMFAVLKKYFYPPLRRYQSENKEEVKKRKQILLDEIDHLKDQKKNLKRFDVVNRIKLTWMIKKKEDKLYKRGYINTIPKSCQETVPFEKIYENGICRVSENYYTKMIQFYDVCYETLDDYDRKVVLKAYSRFLNSFDPGVHVELYFSNRKVTKKELADRITIKDVTDSFSDIRKEYGDILRKQSVVGTGGCIKEKFLVIGVEESSYARAKQKLSNLERETIGRFEKLGTDARSIDGSEWVEIMHMYFKREDENGFSFRYDTLSGTGNSAKDYIVPDCFNFHDDVSYKTGKLIGKVFSLEFTASKIAEGFLPEILNLDGNFTVSLHMKSLDNLQAQKLLKRALMDVQQMKMTEQKRAVRDGYDMDIMPSDIVTYEKQVLQGIEDMNQQNQKVIYMTALINVFGKTRKELNSMVAKLQGIVQGASCEMNELCYLQEKAFVGASPIGINTLGIHRCLFTKNCAILIPFSTRELFMEGQALYYGLNAISKNMILADRKKLRTPNGIILGTPGSGKSFSAKREILGTFLQTEDDILICDPEGEYGSLVKALGGSVITLSSHSKEYMNPLDISIESLEDEDTLKMKSDFIITLIEMMCERNTGLMGDEKGIVDMCIREIYAPFYKNPIPENVPTLSNLYLALKCHGNPKAQALADSMVLFVDGSQNLFNHQTNVDCSNRIICFDCRDLGKQLKPISMLIVQDAVWNRVSRNRNQKKSTRYYCDEFYLLLKEKQTAAYCVEMWRRFRKWGGIPTGMTQNVADFLRSPEIEGIIGNSDFIYLFNQNAQDKEILVSKFGLSERQLSYITSSEPGSGLLLFDNAVIPFVDKYDKNTLTYRLMNTKPEEHA